MPSYDFKSPRLFVAAPLAPGAVISLSAAQAHYLVTVLRLRAGDHVLVFNGADGEWRARLLAAERRSATLEALDQTRAQTPAADVDYLFAPLKQARLDYMVQKAVEMGVARLGPVLTQYTQVNRVNAERMQANAMEAAEQCGILNVPAIMAPVRLPALIEHFQPTRLLVLCDEAAEVSDPIAALAPFRSRTAPMPVAVLIGPEGGFAPAERDALDKVPQRVRIALGPRILRADTAAVAALALVQAVLGDWC